MMKKKLQQQWKRIRLQHKRKKKKDQRGQWKRRK